RPGKSAIEAVRTARERCWRYNWVLDLEQIQADAPPDQGRERLVRPATQCQPNTLCSLDVMSWQRPNIGSRVTREGHARFWERPKVKFLRATRHFRPRQRALPRGHFRFSPKADVRS